MLGELLYPHLDEEHLQVAEVGSGGWRIAAKVAPVVERLVCLDVIVCLPARAGAEFFEDMRTCRIPACSWWTSFPGRVSYIVIHLSDFPNLVGVFVRCTG